MDTRLKKGINQFPFFRAIVENLTQPYISVMFMAVCFILIKKQSDWMGIPGKNFIAAL